MNEYRKKKVINKRIHKEKENKGNMLYGKLLRTEEDIKFLEKYWKLNEKLKDEDQY